MHAICWNIIRPCKPQALLKYFFPLTLPPPSLFQVYVKPFAKDPDSPTESKCHLSGNRSSLCLKKHPEQMARDKMLWYHKLTLSLWLHIRGTVGVQHWLLQASLLTGPTSGWSREENNSHQYWGCQSGSEFKMLMLRFSARPEQKTVLPENTVQESWLETGNPN